MRKNKNLTNIKNMMIELLMIFIGIICALIASYYDIKTREVPDSLNYFLISSAFILKIFQFLSFQDIKIIKIAIFSFLLFFSFSYLMYKTGQWGGGDVKLLAGLSILFASFSSDKFPFFVRLVLNLLIIGAVYGVVYLIVLMIKNFKIVQKEIDFKIKIFSLFLFLLAIFFLMSDFPFRLVYAFFFFIAALYPSIKVTEKVCFEKYVNVGKLTEGDWLIDDVKKNGKIIVKKKKIGLTKEDIRKLKEAKIKKVRIKEGIPFVPSIFLSVLFTLFYKELILLPLIYVQ
jgi:Flp pilus assembly protein protease CpaA